MRQLLELLLLRRPPTKEDRGRHGGGAVRHVVAPKRWLRPDRRSGPLRLLVGAHLRKPSVVRRPPTLNRRWRGAMEREAPAT